jgi:hypothetical protein
MTLISHQSEYKIADTYFRLEGVLDYNIVTTLSMISKMACIYVYETRACIKWHIYMYMKHVPV